jgi:uridylate kinase
MKNIIVISLGGSLIVPHKINSEYLEKFKKLLLKNKKYKFVIVCGGGKTARNYIEGLENSKIKERKKELLQSFLGISATRLNARFMIYFFGKECNRRIPQDMKEISKLLKKHNIVFCGALRYSEKQTSDSTAAKLANYFNTSFINLTNVKGLYNKNPRRFPSAKFIPEISHKDFLNMANSMKFKPGQNFVLDQKAAKTIRKYKIITYILGPDMKQLDNLLNHKHFIGTVIN